MMYVWQTVSVLHDVSEKVHSSEARKSRPAFRQFGNNTDTHHQ